MFILVDSRRTLIGKDKRLVLPSVIPMEEGGVGPAKLAGNPNKKRIISQDNDFRSIFAPSDVQGYACAQ